MVFTLQHDTVLCTWLYQDVCGLWDIGCTYLPWSLVVHSSRWPRTPRIQHETFEENVIHLGDQGYIEGCDTGQALKYYRRQYLHSWWCVRHLHLHDSVTQLVRRWSFLQVYFGPTWHGLHCLTYAQKKILFPTVRAILLNRTFFSEGIQTVLVAWG